MKRPWSLSSRLYFPLSLKFSKPHPVLELMRFSSDLQCKLDLVQPDHSVIAEYIYMASRGDVHKRSLLWLDRRHSARRLWHVLHWIPDGGIITTSIEHWRCNLSHWAGMIIWPLAIQWIQRSYFALRDLQVPMTLLCATLLSSAIIPFRFSCLHFASAPFNLQLSRKSSSFFFAKASLPEH